MPGTQACRGAAADGAAPADRANGAPRQTIPLRGIPYFAWDFGDNHGRTIDCPGKECGDALGLPYVDTAHPSPIRHPYHWSSLGQNGLEDAYTIKLGITFAADFRVTVGGSTGGWQSLPERLLTWTRSHQVQEAQAVLTRP